MNAPMQVGIPGRQRSQIMIIVVNTSSARNTHIYINIYICIRDNSAIRAAVIIFFTERFDLNKAFPFSTCRINK